MSLINVLIELLYALCLPLFGVVLMRVLLLYMDKVIDFDFKDWLKLAPDTAKAYYFSARFIGVCVLVGLALS